MLGLQTMSVLYDCLVVEVLSGNNLAPMDSDGLSDPYVKAGLWDHVHTDLIEMHKSDYISNTLTPTWNQKFVWKQLNMQSQSLIVMVYDHNYIHANQFMGQVVIDIKDLPHEVEVVKTYPLQPRQRSPDQKVQGEISIKLRYSNAKEEARLLAEEKARDEAKKLEKERKKQELKEMRRQEEEKARQEAELARQEEERKKQKAMEERKEWIQVRAKELANDPELYVTELLNGSVWRGDIDVSGFQGAYIFRVDAYRDRKLVNAYHCAFMQKEDVQGEVTEVTPSGATLKFHDNETSFEGKLDFATKTIKGHNYQTRGITLAIMGNQMGSFDVTLIKGKLALEDV